MNGSAPDSAVAVNRGTGRADVKTLLLASIIVRLAALGWSLLLVRRLRDRRMIALAALLALMAARQILTLAVDGPAPLPAAATAPLVSALSELAISILAFATVWWIEDVISDHSRALVRVREYGEELRRSQELGTLGVLAGGLAHEFNNTLTSISGFAELALGRLDRGDAISAHLESVLAAARRGERLARGIAAFARRTRETQAIADLAVETVTVLKLLRVTLPAGLQIRCRLPDGSAPVAGSPAEVQHLLVSLCTLARARWSGTAGGTIEVTVERIAAAIDPEDDEPIFDVVRLAAAIVEVSEQDTNTRPRPTANRARTGFQPAELFPVVREAAARFGGWVEATGEGRRCEVSAFLPAAVDHPDRCKDEGEDERTGGGACRPAVRV